MNDFSKMLEMEPYSLAKAEKEAFLTKCLGSLTIYHYNSISKDFRCLGI